MTDLLLGRQPIFDRHLQVAAYELLYRSVAATEAAAVVDGDLATTQVILNTFSEIGLTELVGDTQAVFINATRSFLDGRLPIPFPPDRVVLEILEDIQADPQLMRGLEALAGQGFQFALDDVVSPGRIGALAGVARIAKVDLRGVDIQALPDLAQSVREHGLRLLAEKVETQEEFSLCRRLGFELFQGYFLCRPTIVRGRRLDASRLILLQSLARMQSPQADFQALEEVIAQDVNLGYKLLKLVNSGYYALPSTVQSIRQAISLIGFTQLRGWITLLLMAAVDNKPHELTVIALVRAKMCEQIAQAQHRTHPETFFLAGLLSVLDALMDTSMETIVGSLPLAPEIAEALLTHTGGHGAVLEAVLAYERGDWERFFSLGIDNASAQRIFLASIRWADVLTRTIQTPA